ncbi:MAG TPA: hypothetical protein VLH86_02810 [Patescibacteria group bacterium]|nr:hypothetical protein [Patescibacteria group bacterium]
MPRYYTSTPWWDRKVSAWEAESQNSAFNTSGEIRDMAATITANPERYAASQHLGHTCLVVVREAHPYEDDRSVASLRDVVGLAIGPGASVIIEEHRTWKGTPERPRDESTFGFNKGGCSTFVREPIGTVSELYLSDKTGAGNSLRDKALGELGPYIGMKLGMTGIMHALEGQDTGDSYRFVTGPEAVEMAAELMGHGHQFAHPALQEWQLGHLAVPEQVA